MISSVPHSCQHCRVGIRIPLSLERELASERQSNLSKDVQPEGEEEEDSRMNVLTSAG